MKNTFEGKTIVTKDNAKVGMYVQRGRDWRWDEQDWFKGKPSVGEIIEEPYFNDGDRRFWVRIEWQSKSINNYRVSDGKFDLVFAGESYKQIINHL